MLYLSHRTQVKSRDRHRKHLLEVNSRVTTTFVSVSDVTAQKDVISS